MGDNSKVERGNMKRFVLVTAALVLLVGTGLAAQGKKTYTGEIMDSAVPAMGSHEGMTKEPSRHDRQGLYR